MFGMCIQKLVKLNELVNLKWISKSYHQGAFCTGTAGAPSNQRATVICVAFDLQLLLFSISVVWVLWLITITKMAEAWGRGRFWHLLHRHMLLLLLLLLRRPATWSQLLARTWTKTRKVGLQGEREEVKHWFLKFNGACDKVIAMLFLEVHTWIDIEWILGWKITHFSFPLCLLLRKIFWS